MRRRFSDLFSPPAPVVPVRIRAPGGIDVALLDGKLDTGADVCAVPERLVQELSLPPVRTVRAAGFGGVIENAIVYRVDLEIGDETFAKMEALVTRRAYAIVGRNVLARCLIRLDGPKRQLDLSIPSTRRGKRRPRAR